MSNRDDTPSLTPATATIQASLWRVEDLALLYAEEAHLADWGDPAMPLRFAHVLAQVAEAVRVIRYRYNELHGL